MHYAFVSPDELVVGKERTVWLWARVPGECGHGAARAARAVDCPGRADLSAAGFVACAGHVGENERAVPYRASPHPGELFLGQGGSRSLRDAPVDGGDVKAVYGCFMEHTIYLVVEADDVQQLNRFLLPGMKVSTAKIRPVS